MEEEWVSSREAWKRLLSDDMHIVAAEAMLPVINLVEGGVLRARATKLRITEETSADDWDPEVKEEQNAQIPDWVWTLLVRRHPDNCDWNSGTIRGSIARHPDGFTTVEAFDIRFNAEDLNRHFPRPGQSSDIPKRGGGPKKADWWPEFTAEMVALVHEEGLPEGKGTEGAEGLIKKVLSRLQERGVNAGDRSTVQPHVNAVLKRLRADN